MVLAQPSDPLLANYPSGGAYVMQTLDNLSAPLFYYGIRRFPFAVKSFLGSNLKPHIPLSFRHHNQDCNKTVSVKEIRSHFPALERQHYGFPVAYFDGPGGTQVPRYVVEQMNDYLFNHKANTHWAYPTSHETDEILAYTRQTLADFLNASPDEIVFGQNMTTLTFHLVRALGGEFQSGDEIIVTELDHHANIDTWRSLEKERGVTMLVLPLNTEIEKLY
jgi:hypothetical protein